MFKLLACVALSSACLLLAPCVQAAVERETFEVFVEIPTPDFYVLPVDPGLVQQEQRLDYSPVSSELRPLRAQFDVKTSAAPSAPGWRSRPLSTTALIASTCA